MQSDRHSKITRRALFLTATAAALAPRLAAHPVNRAAAIVVLLEQIDPRIAAEHLEAIVRAFSERGVPIVVEIGPSMPREHVTLIGGLQRQQPWLIEGAGVLDMETDLPRYFALRAASDLKADLARRGWPQDVAMPGCIPVRPVSEANTHALRAAGFRVRISGSPGPLQEPTTITQTDWGQIEITGGNRRDLGSDRPSSSAMPPGEDALLRLSVGATHRAADAAAWAQALQAVITTGESVVARPSDLLGLLGGGASSFLSLVVDAQGERGSDGPVGQFLSDLQAQDLPYGLIADAATRRQEPPGVCGPDTAASYDSLLRNCIVADPEDDLLLASDIRIVLATPRSRSAWTGQRSDGRFQVALVEWAEGSLAERLDRYPLSDHVMLIGPGDLATPVQRRAIIAQIHTATSVGRVHIRSIDGYLDEILAPDHQLRHLWSVRERFETLAFAPLIVGSAEEDERQRDAQAAWAFIDRHTDTTTGLCAGTVNWGNVRTIDRNITFWDVGSQIQGILAAQGLGLISAGQARERLDALIASLPVTTIDGRPLPPAIFEGKTRRPVSAEFDSCDIGRFLIALRQAVHRGMVAEPVARDLLGSWSLSTAIREGQIHDYRAGKWVNAGLTHCNTYALRGFRQWGLTFQRAYPPIPARPNSDDLMRLYYAATDIGHFGAEPSLLDLIETNGETASLELAKVLLDAQIAWHETTGRPKCVSESPLNFHPWFVFQGLRLDRAPQGAWIIRARIDDKTVNTPQFQQKADVISSKSAFLWQARFPHPYARMLVSMVRENARVDGEGFVAGLFATDLSPMKDYGDLNTNGIILEALDYMKRWRRADWSI